MKVLKFGGTSVGSIQGIKNIKSIVESEPQPVIVVVSALSTVTDRLVEATKLAKDGKVKYRKVIDQIVDIHHKLIEAVIPGKQQQIELEESLQKNFDELAGILQGVYLIKDVTAKIQDVILSYGERCSSPIVTALIQGAKLYDSRQFIKTEKKSDKITVNYEITNRQIRKIFADMDGIAIVPGFIASDAHTAITTTLGRGGSDYTASIIAAALHASALEIWTDVDGFMTADPRIVSSAYSIEALSYNEAMELCNFGAKVIYPPTIYPVRRLGIPIYIKNTFRPSFAGSVIREETPPNPRLVRGLSAIKDTAVVNVSGMSMVGVIGINRRIFSSLADAGVSVFMVAQTSSETSTSLCVRPEDADRACEVLNEEFSKEIQTGAMNPMHKTVGLSTIAIVGEEMKNSSEIAGKLFSVLGRNGIRIIALAQGDSEMNISAIIERKNLQKASGVIHDSFFLSDNQVLNIVLCGVGSVGSSLLKQLHEQREQLMKQRRLKLNLVGLANSRHAIFNTEGIAISDNPHAQLEDAPLCNVQKLRDEVIAMNLYNCVFVDCTANAEVAALYEPFLSHNISVVAANKISAAAPYETYRLLKQTALKRGVKYLYETNVGAGLPILKTINDLCASGDEILEIQAVLSGTLNFIFNTLSDEHPLSEVIRMAKEAHISEPDPRIDLQGKDVLRKLVILVREAGYKINQEDVEIETFIPDKYFQGTTEDFMKNVSELDGEFDALQKKMAREKKRLRFIARWADGKATVRLTEVDRNHPFYNLEDSNNMVLLTTKRYRKYPMIIQGYGAGADVTAAGVFADIMRVANI